MSLKMTIMGILEEYVRKNEVNQSLIRRVSEAEFSGSQTGRLSREMAQNVLNSDLQVRLSIPVEPEYLISTFPF